MRASMPDLMDIGPWFAKNKQTEFRPELMKMKMMQENFVFHSDLPAKSLQDLLITFCDHANAQHSNAIDRNTQRDLTLRLVRDAECPLQVCIYLYNGLRSHGDTEALSAPYFHNLATYTVDQHAVLLEALSITLTAAWRE